MVDKSTLAYIFDPNRKRVFTTAPHTDTHRRSMLYEVVDGKLKRIGRRNYYDQLRWGNAVEVPWDQIR